MKCNDINNFKEFIFIAIANKHGVDLRVSSIISDDAGIDSYIISIIYSDLEKIYDNVLSKVRLTPGSNPAYEKYKDTLILFVDRLKNGTISPQYIIHEVSINYGLSAVQPDTCGMDADKDVEKVECKFCGIDIPKKSANTFEGPSNYICSSCEAIAKKEVIKDNIRKAMTDAHSSEWWKDNPSIKKIVEFYTNRAKGVDADEI